MGFNYLGTFGKRLSAQQLRVCTAALRIDCLIKTYYT